MDLISEAERFSARLKARKRIYAALLSAAHLMKYNLTNEDFKPTERGRRLDINMHIILMDEQDDNVTMDDCAGALAEIIACVDF